MAQPLSQQDAPDGAVTDFMPRLQEAIRIENDTTMRDSPDIASGVARDLNIDSTDDDDAEDSMTDDTSDDGEHDVPKGLPMSTLPTGLCYDERMRYHSEVSAPTGDSVHPEDPRRIYYIYKELCEAGLVNEGERYKAIVDPPLKRIEAREATKEEICLVHTDDHYEFVKRTSTLSHDQLIDLSENPEMDSIYFNALSYYSGKLSAGGAIETCRAVVSREVKNAIAVIRPPGHHAEVGCTMGFCLFNNTCVASKVCQGEFGESCRKILILDWDVHHGNGCQKAFYDDPNILYISLHVHMNGNFYPSGPEGDLWHCGEGYGLGYNVNIPWETKGMGDGDYMYAFQHVVMPIATEFDPDLVIVSAGFDAAAGDELGGCFVTPACYAHMTHMLMSLANGKVAVCLEGGYNFQAISRSALAVTRTLMGEPPERLTATRATQRGIQVVQQVREVQSEYWSSIYPKDLSYGIRNGETLHDIIREWQAMHLYDKYRLIELRILRSTISRSFAKQVLATPDYESKQHLLIFVHDPPDLVAKKDVLNNKLKPHQTWLNDATQSYVHTAVSHGFGVVDINIPEHITVTPNVVSDRPDITHPSAYAGQLLPYNDINNDLARKEAEKLMVYVWENYIEPFDFDHIVLIGAGNAFHAVAKLISDSDQIYNSLTCVISFIHSHPVRPVNNANNPWLGQWYATHSQIYISHDHSIWKKDKISKRYGKAIRSPAPVSAQGLNAMMKAHKQDVWTFIKTMVPLPLEAGDSDTSRSTDEHADTEDEDETEDQNEHGGSRGHQGQEYQQDDDIALGGGGIHITQRHDTGDGTVAGHANLGDGNSAHAVNAGGIVDGDVNMRV